MKKILRAIFYFCVVLLVLVGILLFFLQTPNGQKFVSDKVSDFLQKKLKTTVKADISYHFPDWIALENVFLKDLKGDTLLTGKKLHADIDMWSLIRYQTVKTNNIHANGIKININRTENEFNYQFLLDAFTDNSQPKTQSKPLDIELGKVQFDEIKIKFNDYFLKNFAHLSFQKFNTEFEKINLLKQQFYLKDIDFEGLSIETKLTKLENSPTPKTPQSTKSLDLKFGNLTLKNSTFNIDLLPYSIRSHGKIQDFLAKSEKIDLEKGEFLFKKIETKHANLTYENTTTSKKLEGFDHNHLELTNFNFFVENVKYSPESTNFQLKSLKFFEKSGLKVENFKTDFLLTQNNISLRNLLFKTPETTIQDKLIIRFNSIEDLSKNFENISLETNIANTKISTNDIFKLIPDLAKNPNLKKIQNEIFSFNAQTTGKISDLSIKNLTIKGLENTELELNGKIQNLTNIEKVNFQLNLNKLNIQKNKLQKFLPDSIIPPTIEIPNQISLQGKINGNLENMALNTTAFTDFGLFKFEGNYAKSGVDGVANLENFDLGKFIKQPEKIGLISLKTDLKIKDFDPKFMKIETNGIIENLDYNQYHYRNIKLKTIFYNQILALKTQSEDPNLLLDLDTKIDISSDFPAIVGNAKIHKLDLLKLNFYPENLSIAGNFDFDLKNTNPENFLGNIKASESAIYKNGNKINVGNFLVNVIPNINERGVRGEVSSSFANLTFSTTTSTTDLVNAVLTQVNQYFELPNIAYQPFRNPYQISINGYLKNHPIITGFIPEIKSLDSLQFNAEINSEADTSLKIATLLPYAKYDSNTVRNLQFSLIGNGKIATYNADLQEFNNGSMRIRKANIYGEIANNLALFNFSVKDSLNRPIHGIAGNLWSANKHLFLGLQPSGSMLNYKKWQADPSGFVDISSEGFVVNNLNLSSEKQYLKINSTSNQPNSPLKIEADSLDLQTLLTAILQDSTLAGGKIYGNGNFIMKNATFTGDFQIRNLEVTKIPIGDLSINLTNELADRIHAKGSLKNQENDIDLDGNYFIEKQNPLDLSLNIKQLGAKTIEAFSFGNLKNTSGNLNGKLSIKGKTDSPEMKGNISFQDFGFVLPQTQAKYRINNQNLNFDGQNIFLRNFILEDSLKQKLETDGLISIKNLPNVSYNLNIKANNFLALNTTRKDNDFVFGKANINPLMNIQGTNANYKVSGKVKVNQGSELTMIMPDEVGSEGSGNGIVEFVGLKETLLKPSQKVVEEKSSGEISLNIEADEKSELKIIIDELNGDYMKAKGNANLFTEINEAGQMKMTGKYEISEGTYEMTYQFLKKPFIIKKGSNIVWESDPMKGKMDITAEYKVQIPVYDFIKSESSQTPSEVYKKEIPLVVQLKMTEELLKPNIEFHLVADDEKIESVLGKNEIDSLNIILKNLDNDKVQVRKQVFSILVLNRFIPESFDDIFAGFNTEAIARQSVSKLVSEQLNRFAGNIIKGVKLDLNVASDYNSVNDERSTNLGLGLSKSFFNERLSVSVGRNFELENAQTKSNEIFDNITLNYNLSKDGRYRFKAFRKNQFILEGFVVETGVGFTIALDFDKMRELLGSN